MVCFKNICISLVWVFRIIALLLFTLILALSIGAFVISQMITPKNLTSIVSGRMYEIFKKPVIIEKVTVVFFKGIKVNDARILDTSNNLGKDLLSSREITLSYQFLPLLKKQVIIDEITIDNPKINLIKNRDGTWNFKEIIPQSHEAKSRADGIDLYFNVKKISIENAVVSILNLPRERTDVFYNVGLRISDVKRSGKFPYDLNLVSKNEIAGKTVSFEISANGFSDLSDFDWQNAFVSDTSARINFLSGPIDLDMSFTSFVSPKFKVFATVAPITYKDLSLFIKKPVSLYFPKSDWKMQGYLSDKLYLDSITAAFEDVKLSSTGWVEFLKDTTKMGFEIESNVFDISVLARYWGDMLKFAPKGKINFKAKLSGDKNKISLGEVEFTAKDAKAAIGDFICSNATLNARLENGLNKISLKSQDGTVKVGGQKFTGLKINGQYSKDNIVVNSLTGNYNGEDIRAKIRIDNLKSNKNRKVSFVMKLEHLKLPLLFDTVKDFSKAISKKKPRPLRWQGKLAWLGNFKDKLPKFIANFKGTVYASKFTTPVISGSDLKLEYDFKGLRPRMEKLNGRVDFTMGPGIIYKLETMAEKEKALGVFYKPFIAMHQLEQSGAFQSQILKNAGYKQVAGAFNFENGTSIINNFFIDGVELSAAADGKVDWVGESLDIAVRTIFKTTGYGGLSENLTDESGNPALYFKVNGAMTAPLVNMKSPKTVGRYIESAINRKARTSFYALREIR